MALTSTTLVDTALVLRKAPRATTSSASSNTPRAVLAGIVGKRKAGDFEGALQEVGKGWDDLIGQPPRVLMCSTRRRWPRC